MMNWFDRHPEDLAEQSEPADALAALRQVEQLNARQMVALDVCLNQWVVMLIMRPSDREGVLELERLCNMAQSLAPPDVEAQRLCLRWKAFADLLEGKRHALQNLAIATPVKLLHEDEIISLGLGGEYKQSALTEKLKLSRGRVSQILSVLEAQNKITRERRGKDSWVSLAANTANAQPSSNSGLAMTFFSHQKAA